MNTVVNAVLLWSLCVNSAIAIEWRKIGGHVVDDIGRPVAGAKVSFFWRGNGSLKFENGKPVDPLDTPEDRMAFRSKLGQMFPVGRRDIDHITTTGADGRFSIDIPAVMPHLMATDQDGQRGGLVIWSASDEPSDVEIRLGPLVGLKAVLEGPEPGQRHDLEGNVTVFVAKDKTRLLDNRLLAMCGTVDSRIEFRLPPGSYELDAVVYRETESARIDKKRELVLPNNVTEVDLGVLSLGRFLSESNLVERQRRAEALGGPDRFYGQSAPELSLLGVRGLSKDVTISSFRGKWLLVVFWDTCPWCTPCLRKRLPALTQFYEEHASDRDRFEILAVCVDRDDQLHSMADLEALLEPIEANSWKKRLPFPVALDDVQKTWERYGMNPPTVNYLINPEGSLVEGDETTLAEKLKAK